MYCSDSAKVRLSGVILTKEVTGRRSESESLPFDAIVRLRKAAAWDGAGGANQKRVARLETGVVDLEARRNEPN